MEQRTVDSDGITELMEKLPGDVQSVVLQMHREDRVEEITMDAGKSLWVTTASHGPVEVPEVKVTLDQITDFAGKVGGNAVGADNRTGVDNTLHRISFIRDRDDTRKIGATIRFGIPMHGVAEILRDTLQNNPSLMVIGPPAVGKTTLLRDIIRILGELKNRRGHRMGPRVLYVDTSSEMGGFGSLPHPSLGNARRIPVPDAQNQSWQIMQAVGNHSASVVVVDEIKSRKDAMALAECLQRGVKAVATCHGEQLSETIANRTFSCLLGDLDTDPVTRRLRRYTQPIFASAVEVWGFGRLVLHPDLKESIDRILAGKMPRVIILGEWSDAQYNEMVDAVSERVLQRQEETRADASTEAQVAPTPRLQAQDTDTLQREADLTGQTPDAAHNQPQRNRKKQKHRSVQPAQPIKR